MYPTELCINGELRASLEGGTMPQFNPADETQLTTIASASNADVIAAIDGAHHAFVSGWRDLAPGKRASLLFEFAGRIRAEAETLALIESRNMGKPISDARDEILLGARVFEYYAGGISRFFGQTIPVARGGFDFTLHQPMGVVAAIVPWNFPFPIACWKVAPAIATGNTVVLKPASLSALTALMLGRIGIQSGLPPGVLQVVTGSGKSLGKTLVQHPLVRKVSFTGSTEVGVEIMTMASTSLKRVSLELGGKSPNIVFADADIERAAEGAPMSVFANTGQDCCARSRVFVEKRVFDRFVEHFLSATSRLIVGDPSADSTQLGPLVSAQQRTISENYLDDAKKLGRRLVAGGDRVGTRGFYIRPAVLLDVEPSDKVWREEVFGPVVCIRPFEDEAQMLQEVNASPYGLSGSIWTNDLTRALRVSRAVESGVLSVNSHSSVHVEAPFGGFKMSGIGRDLGMAAMQGYTETKNIYIATN